MKHGEVNTNSSVNAPNGLTSPTPGTSITIDLSLNTPVYKWTAGQSETINASGSQFAGQRITLIIANDAVLGRLITFGTGFKSIGTLTGVVSTTSVMEFISDGTNLYEASRTLAIL